MPIFMAFPTLVGNSMLSPAFASFEGDPIPYDNNLFSYLLHILQTFTTHNVDITISKIELWLWRHELPQAIFNVTDNYPAAVAVATAEAYK